MEEEEERELCALMGSCYRKAEDARGSVGGHLRRAHQWGQGSEAAQGAPDEE